MNMMTEPLLPGLNDYSPADWCSLQDVMDLLQFEARDSGWDRTRLFRRCRVKSGQSIFSVGQPYKGLFVVRMGAVKTIFTHADESEQVRSFSTKGSLLGIEGVSNQSYNTEAVALTHCDVILLPENALFLPDSSCNELERMVYWAMSREMAKELTAHTISNLARAEARVARFLAMQSDIFSISGHSPRQLSLPMTRRDIGSYLGLSLETVSRAFSALQQRGAIRVENRKIYLCEPDTLRHL